MRRSATRLALRRGASPALWRLAPSGPFVDARLGLVARRARSDQSSAAASVAAAAPARPVSPGAGKPASRGGSTSEGARGRASSPSSASSGKGAAGGGAARTVGDLLASLEAQLQGTSGKGGALFDYARQEGFLKARYHHVRFSEKERQEEWRVVAPYEADDDEVAALWDASSVELRREFQVDTRDWYSTLADRARKVVQLLTHRALPVPEVLAGLVRDAEARAADKALIDRLEADPVSREEARHWTSEHVRHVIRVVSPPVHPHRDDAASIDADLAVPGPLPKDSPFPTAAAWRRALLDAYESLHALSFTTPGAHLEVETVRDLARPRGDDVTPWFVGDADDQASFKREERILHQQVDRFPRRRLPSSLEDTAPVELRDVARALEDNPTLSGPDRAKSLKMFADLHATFDAAPDQLVDEDFEHAEKVVEPHSFTYRMDKPWEAPHDLDRADPLGLSSKDAFVNLAEHENPDKHRVRRTVDELFREPKAGARVREEDEDADGVAYDDYLRFLRQVPDAERSAAHSVVQQEIKKRR